MPRCGAARSSGNSWPTLVRTPLAHAHRCSLQLGCCRAGLLPVPVRAHCMPAPTFRLVALPLVWMHWTAPPTAPLRHQPPHPPLPSRCPLPSPAAKLAVLLKRSRQAKAEVERALAAKLGRRVNIQGEINQLLAG